ITAPAPRDHLRDQPAVPRRGARQVPGRRCPAAPDVADRRGQRQSVRMAHLATVGSRAINGVAALHSELLKDSVLKDFYELWPERFSNKTNGVTPRRFLALANPGLRELLDDTIGDGWLADPYPPRRVEALAGATGVHSQS